MTAAGGAAPRDLSLMRFFAGLSAKGCATCWFRGQCALKSAVSYFSFADVGARCEWSTGHVRLVAQAREVLRAITYPTQFRDAPQASVVTGAR